MFRPANDTTPAAPTDRLTAITVGLFPRLLGALFLFTGTQKLLKSEALFAVLRFDGFPEAMIPAIAYAVITTELLAGVLLVTFIWRRRATILGSVLLLLLYTAQIGFLVMNAEAPNCDCIGVATQHANNQRANLLNLTRNVCLIIPALWTLYNLPAAARPSALDPSAASE